MTDSVKSCFPDVYDILEKIGRGGTADIYLAHRQGNAQPVVLKQFYDPAAADLVNREKLIADRVHFPGIIRVHRSGKTSDGAHFLQMEYCPGPTLEELSGRISETKLLAIMSAVAASLTVLHKAGFVHNDLKPSNIFCPVGFDDESFPVDRLFYLKLADFSLAEDYTIDKNTAVTGTVGYMSPEMILKKKISPSSDLFSLGVLAYQLTCGRMPFESDAGDPLEINAQVTEGPRPSLCGPGEAFSTEISDLIMSLIEVEPSGRPPSAFALQEILSRLRSPYPFRKSVRPRHLIRGVGKIDAGILSRLFGEGCLSPRQANFIERTTGFEPARVRILLEENFDQGNFTRMNGRWGWKNEKAEIIEWSRRQSRFSLRPLRGSSVSLKKLALALAIVGNSRHEEKVSHALKADDENLQKEWQEIPEYCRPALLYSLDCVMRPSTRKSLSSRMIDLFHSDKKHQGLAGRLLFYAGRFREAIDFLERGIEESSGNFEHDRTFELIGLALRAAQKLGDISQQATILLTRARLEKDLVKLEESEQTYLQIVGMLEGEEQIALRARTYKEMGDFFKIKNDHKSGIDVLSKALELYNTIDDPLRLSQTLNNLGNMYWLAGELDESLKNYKAALVIQERLLTHKEIATSLNNIGSIYVMKGDYSEGLAHYNKSLEIRKRLGEKGPVAQSWNNLGAIHFLMGDAVKATESFTHSLRLNREVGAKAVELLNIENLAEATILAGRLQEALKYLKEGTVLAEKHGETSHRCTINRLTGQLLLRMGYYDEAEAKLQSALSFASQIDNRALILLCRVGLSHFYLALREEKMLAQMVMEGTTAAREMGDKNALFHLALIQYAHTGKENYKSVAEGMVKDLDTVRDKALLYLTLLERQNHLGETEQSSAFIAHVNPFFGKQSEDIDLARYHFALARYNHLIEDNQHALELAEKTIILAGKLNLLPEQWQALAFLSELRFMAKDFEASFKYARRASDCLRKAASHIKDSNRLGRLYNDQRIIALLGRIKSLQAIMSKKEGAAVSSP
jgi:serine/threonine protein kinase/Tfp pilus assembly protein PilF